MRKKYSTEPKANMDPLYEVTILSVWNVIWFCVKETVAEFFDRNFFFILMSVFEDVIHLKFTFKF
jgi:hypothetical protein